MRRKHLSFQEEISGRIASLLMDAGMPSCTATRDGLAAIIDSLSSYQEEGHRLYPKFIITENIQEVKLLLPQSEEIHIGSGQISVETYRKCLKMCAPLAIGEWYIFIERGSSEIRYGLIRSGDSVISPLPESLIRELSSEPIIVLRQVTDRTVEAVTSNDHSLSISFSGRSTMETDRRSQLLKLFVRISELADLEIQDKLQIFLYRIFGNYSALSLRA